MKKKKDEITIRSSAAEYLTYVASVGDQQYSVEMRYEDENIWLTQKMMATLYDVGTNTINYHIKKIFEDSELQEDSVIRKFRITAADGKSYSTNHYSLEMIIAVGFKVNSERAVQFRKWVNQIAKDYTIKGWVMDDERLKRGTYLTSMHLIHIVRLYFFFCLCIEKHSRNCIFLLSKLITPIFYVCKNLIQIIGMNRMFIKLGLCCVTIVFCVNNKYSIATLQMNITLHDRKHGSNTIIQ